MGEGTAERGGESDDDEEGEVRTPYGEVHTHTMWRFNGGHVRLLLE